jgi:hypothetical protein
MPPTPAAFQGKGFMTQLVWFVFCGCLITHFVWKPVTLRFVVVFLSCSRHTRFFHFLFIFFQTGYSQYWLFTIRDSLICFDARSVVPWFEIASLNNLSVQPSVRSIIRLASDMEGLFPLSAGKRNAILLNKCLSNIHIKYSFPSAKYIKFKLLIVKLLYLCFSYQTNNYRRKFYNAHASVKFLKWKSTNIPT